MRTRGGGRREEGGVIEKQQTKRLHEMLMRVLISCQTMKPIDNWLG